MDIIPTNVSDKNFRQFWKNTNKLNPKSSIPVSVAGLSEPTEIADLFKTQFKVESPLSTFTSSTPMINVEGEGSVEPIHILAKDVAHIIKTMKRGKSPGHDCLSIEHLRHAGVHLPRVLAMFYSCCISHSYLPNDLMKTVVVPIVKNRTGDVSDPSNYRPISLATIIAKILDSLLDQQLSKHVHLHDAQFGFRAGLSTESAILCLKQTVQYYTSRNTPVYACFLDLSKAFDLVDYDILWQKLRTDTDLPRELIRIFQYWYSNQVNNVRWAGRMSGSYRSECGVRQGGLSSPRLFNLYVNQLIVELNNTNVGCRIEGISANNLSYADDMVLLSPSIRALRKMVSVCESFAVAHGLRYNEKKCELLVFKSGNKTYSHIPPVTINGNALNITPRFKYLGHWVTDSLNDDLDLERERRALCVRVNMLARRFASCTDEVKVTLFRAYCQSFYTCSLWTRFTQKALNALRVQYNNAFRVLLGLPRFCSASGMFAVNRVDGFHAILRKRCASLRSRIRGSPNSIVNVFSERWDCPLNHFWMQLHTLQ